MLFKIVKYDFKNNANTFWILYLALLLLSMITRYGGYNVAGGQVALSVASGISMTLYTLLLVGTLVYLFVSIIKSYYVTMFKNAGYLTLTLPVSSAQLIIAKVINATIWLVLTAVATLLSLFILTTDYQQFAEILKVLPKYFDLGKTLVWLLYIFVSYISSIMLIFLVITFVNSVWIKKYRGIIGVAAYFALSWALSSIESLITPKAANFGGVDALYGYNVNQTISSYTRQIALPGILWGLIIMVLCFAGIRYLLNSKIEID